MLCPTCQVELQISERQGIEIDYCPKCRGVWLDRGELDKIIERTNASFESYAAPPAPAADARKRKPVTTDGELPYDYDDDDYHERRYDERYPRRRKKSFLDDVFDIFD